MARRVIKPTKVIAPAAEPMFDAGNVVLPPVADDEIPAFLKKGSTMKAIETVAPPEATPAPPAPEAPAKRQRAPGATYAALFAQAEQGILPPAPDLSAPTHKAFAKRGAKIVAMAEAGDIEGLQADTMEPKSSSRAIICRYRDLAIVALAARGRMS